jgi:hypothetical protein
MSGLDSSLVVQFQEFAKRAMKSKRTNKQSINHRMILNTQIEQNTYI